MLSRQHLKTWFFHEAYQLLDDEKQVTLHQANRHGCTHSGEDAETGSVGDGLLLALLLMFGLLLIFVAAGLLLGMMDRAGCVRADLVDAANVAPLGDDGIGGELAHFELRPLRLILRLWLMVTNGGVLVAWESRAAFFL
jgi:hypothetical protein